MEVAEKPGLGVLMFLGGAESDALPEERRLSTKKMQLAGLNRMLVGVYSTVLGNPKWKSRYNLVQ
jgi:hypothetical protein